MSLKIENDPNELVIRAVENLWPNIKAIIQYNPELRGPRHKECGCTTFPDDGSTPLIDLSPNMPMNGIAETLAHELAHVVVPDDGHGKKWAKAFEDIHQEYKKICMEEYKT